MTPANQPGQPSEEIISAKMLAKVLEVRKFVVSGSLWLSCLHSTRLQFYETTYMWFTRHLVTHGSMETLKCQADFAVMNTNPVDCIHHMSLNVKAVKMADRSSDGFEVEKLDKFMEKAVMDGAFDHIRYMSPSGSNRVLFYLVHSQISTVTIAEAGFDTVGFFIVCYSELLKNGCDLEKHFTAVLRKISKDEIDTTQCMILAITMARYSETPGRV